MANLDSFANKTEQDFQLMYKGELETVFKLLKELAMEPQCIYWKKQHLQLIMSSSDLPK